jgi:hypothetical protein
MALRFVPAYRAPDQIAHFIYFHQEAERLASLELDTLPEDERHAPDIASCLTPTILDQAPEGEYEAEVCGVAGRVFLWQLKDWPKKGLIVVDSDEAGVADARAKYEQRTIFI